MHGLGNDFIVVDCRDTELPVPALFAERYCDRRFGVGADQVLMLFNASEADFRMAIYNSDGGEVEMCGNGIRCLAKYIWDRNLSDKEVLDIETPAGIIRPRRSGDLVRVDMGEPVFDAERIPVELNATADITDCPITSGDREFRMTCVSMGNPHAVIFLEDDVARFDVEKYGRPIETHPMFPKRTNVEFVNVNSRTELTMRVWERGSGQTLACGTGASATGVAAMLKGLADRSVTVHLAGGDLSIGWAADNHVYMTGPAVEVFSGHIKTNEELERRRSPRRLHKRSFDVFLKGKTDRIFCTAVSVDISETGIGLVCNGSLEPGHVVLFRDRDNSSEMMVGIVRWCSKMGDKYKAGLMFI